jgi:hypothetical protein
MIRHLFYSTLVSAVVAGLSGHALAAASDYTFELASTQLTAGDAVPVAVRLVHKKTGKPIVGAVITRIRLDMAPEGMAEHTSPISVQPGGDAGVYGFKADLAMEGRWQLSLAAKVQGEPETVVGKIILKVGR